MLICMNVSVTRPLVISTYTHADTKITKGAFDQFLASLRVPRRKMA